jgi:hypothetical protein
MWSGGCKVEWRVPGMRETKSKTEKKPYEKPKVLSSEAFQVEATSCSLFYICPTSEGT